MAGLFSKLFSTDDKATPRREDLYRSLFEQAAVGIALVGKDGQWLQMNDRLLRLLGYPREEILRTNLRELTHPEDRKTEAPMMRRLMGGELQAYTIEKRMMQRDRRFVTLRVNVSRCRKDDLEYHAYIFSSPLETKAAAGDAPASIEEALEKTESIGVLRIATDGTITSWNRGAEKIFGYKASEIVSKPRSLLYRDVDSLEKQPRQDVLQALTAGVLEQEAWRVNKDGFTIWLHTTLLVRRDERGAVELVEIVQQPSHQKQDATKGRSDQLLEDARSAYAKLKEHMNGQLAEAQNQYEQLKDESARRIIALARKLQETQADVEARTSREASLQEELQQIRTKYDQTFNDLRSMTEALRKELVKRKKLEQLVLEVRRQYTESNERWRAEVDRLSVTGSQPFAPSAGMTLTGKDIITTDVTAFMAALIELGANRENGTLVARCGDTEKRFIIEEGRLDACVSSPSSSPPLGEVLLGRGMITAEDRDRALEIQQETGIALGRIFVIMGAISETTLVELMRERSRLEAVEMLEWPEVEHFFSEEALALDKLVPLHLDIPFFVAQLVEHEPEPAAGDVSGEVIVTAASASSSETLFDGDDTNPVGKRAELEPAAVEVVAAPSAAVIEAPPAPMTARADSAAPSPAIDETSAEQPMFIGSASRGAKKYHLPACKSVARLDPSKRIPFATLQEAERGGFTACAQCAGKQPKKKPSATTRRAKKK